MAELTEQDLVRLQEVVAAIREAERERERKAKEEEATQDES